MESDKSFAKAEILPNSESKTDTEKSYYVYKETFDKYLKFMRKEKKKAIVSITSGKKIKG